MLAWPVSMELIDLPFSHLSHVAAEYRTAQPDSLRHRRLRMTGTVPHALRGSASRGTQLGHNRDRGPRAGHAGAARRCTKRHCRPWALPGPRVARGTRELRVDACTSRHRRPRDPRAGSGPEELTRSGRTDVYPHDLVTGCFQSLPADHGRWFETVDSRLGALKRE